MLKKVLCIILSVLMVTVCAVPGFASHSPADAYAAYDAQKTADNDSAYIAGLSFDQLAGIVLDYIDAKLASADEQIEIADGVTLSTADMLDLSTVTAWAYDAINSDMLGGDFDKLDASALAGLSRAGGDLNYIYGIITFISDNASLFGKVFRWDEGNTFDCGKIGEYIETLEETNKLRVFYEDYILGNNIQEKFTNEVAGEMNYTPADAETLDDVINNGVLDWITGMLGDAGILSPAAQTEVKSEFNLRTTGIYTLIKELTGVIMQDNQAKIDMYLHLYLDDYVRTLINATFGYTPKVGDAAENAAAVTAEFKAVYQDIPALFTLAGSQVKFRAADLSFYEVTIDSTDVTAVNTMEFVNESGIEIAVPTVEIYTKAAGGDSLIKEYAPTTADVNDYLPKVYSSYAAAAGVEAAGTALPAEYNTVIENGTQVAMDEYIKVNVIQNGSVTMTQSVSFAEIKAAAEAAALQAGQNAAQGMGGTCNSVNINFGYTGYAVDNTFIMRVAVTSATASITYMGFTIPEFDVSSFITNPIADVVITNLTAPGSGDDASGLFNFIDREYVVDYSEFLDIYGNYDEYNGVVGQVNHILCGMLDMLLSDEGYESLNLTDGNNTNLTDNIQKLCTKADALISTAKQYMSEEGLDAYLESAGVDAMFGSAHGFNTSMIYNLDFSSVESAYVCIGEMALDMFDDFDKDAENDLIHKLHTAVEGLDTLDAIAVAGTDVAVNEIILPEIADFVAEFNTANDTAFTFSYVNTPSDASLITDNAKDVIMSKLVSLAVYSANFVYDNIINSVLNKVVDTVNDKLSLDLGDVSLTLGLADTGDRNADLSALVNRFTSLTSGIIIAVNGIDSAAPVFDKISAIANAVLPVSTFFSNCSSSAFACDFGHILNDYIFTDALNGDFEGFIRLFEAYNETEQNKKNDIAAGSTATYTLIKASDYIVDSIFPGTVNSEDFANIENYTNVQNVFTSAANDNIIAANNMRSLNSVKADIVPAVLGLIRETGILPSLVNADCVHADVITVSAIPATCLTTGYTEGTRCKDCGKWLTGHILIAATGHNYTLTSSAPATCTQDGETVYTCQNCFDVKTEITVATGHNFIWVTDSAATCCAAGAKHEKCTKCDAVRSNATVIPATGAHTLGEAQITPATCTENGTSVRRCTTPGCTYSEMNSIPATGHADSNTDYVCDICGAELEKPAEKPTFIQRIQQFFQSIINFFRNLFK